VSLRNVAVTVYRGGAGFYHKMSVLVDTIQYTFSKHFMCRYIWKNICFIMSVGPSRYVWRKLIMIAEMYKY